MQKHLPILQKHVSITTHPQVLTKAKNGKGESAVKTTKQLPHNAADAVTYLSWTTNTPTDGIESSPANVSWIHTQKLSFLKWKNH